MIGYGQKMETDGLSGSHAHFDRSAKFYLIVSVITVNVEIPQYQLSRPGREFGEMKI